MPEEVANDNVEDVGNHDIGPKGRQTVHVLWCQCYEDTRTLPTFAISVASDKIYWDQNSTTYDGQDYEYVSAHVCEAQENCGVQANSIYQLLLFRRYDWR